MTEILMNENYLMLTAKVPIWRPAFTEDELNWMQREFAMGTNSLALKLCIEVLERDNNAEQGIRETEQAEEREAGDSETAESRLSEDLTKAQEAVREAYGKPGIFYDPRTGGFVKGSYTSGKASPQAPDTQAEDSPDRGKPVVNPAYGCTSNPCRTHGNW